MGHGSKAEPLIAPTQVILGNKTNNINSNSNDSKDTSKKDNNIKWSYIISYIIWYNLCVG